VGEAEGGEPIGSAAGGRQLSQAGTVELKNRTHGRFGGRIHPDAQPAGPAARTARLSERPRHAATERTSLALAGPATAGVRYRGGFSGRRRGRLGRSSRSGGRDGGGAVVTALVAVGVDGTAGAAPLGPVRRRRSRRHRGQQRRPARAARRVADGVAAGHRRGGRSRDRAQLRTARGVDLPAAPAVGPAVRRLQPGRGGLAADQHRRRRVPRRHRPVLPARQPGRYRRCLRHQLRGQLDVDLEWTHQWSRSR
jgi:hypothetical protein